MTSKLDGLAHEQHRARVHELVAQRDARMLGGDLVRDGPPEARGREDVRLVDRRHVPAAVRGKLERQCDDPADLRCRIRQGVERVAVRVIARGFAPVPEVDPARELPDDEHVHAVEELGPER